MSKSMQDIIGEANTVFHENFIQKQHDKTELRSSVVTKEVLAHLITLTIEDLYSSASSDETNLSRITTGLQFDIDALGEVVQHLQTLRLDWPVQHRVREILAGTSFELGPQTQV